ncbi:MAG: DNA polymerase III subunit delta [Akkermansiaceae bacterium]|nr:DNA polymerase III subunit delta [Akkermansiaceae bacterium]
MAEEASVLFNELKPEGGDEFTNDVVDGIAANAEDAYQACARTIEALQTIGFFGGAKVVWLKAANFLADDRTGAAERTKDGVEALLDVLKGGLGEEVVFLLSAAGIDKRRAFYKWLQKNAEVAVFDRIDVSKEGWEDKVSMLVMTRAKELKLTFEDDALELFVQRAGADTRQIGNELEKLRLYVGENGLVKMEAVERMVPTSRKGVIWEIGKALERRQAARAVALIDAQLEKGENAVGLMRASIIPTVRKLFMVRILMDAYPKLPTQNPGSFAKAVESLPAGDLAWLPQKKAGGVNAWGLGYSAGAARQFSADELRAALEACLHADRSLVTTQLDARMVLHRLVMVVCGEARRKKSA